METFISSYIRDPIPFIVIGGPSGIGKTQLIDALFNLFPDAFAQPLSYTTRPRRNEADRYEFISESEMRGMYARGELLNLDKVHGYFYGMAIGAVERLQSTGRIPVKEIHPKNFHKLNIGGLNVLKVLVENRHRDQKSVPFVSRVDRDEDDFDFEIFEDYDIRLNVAGMDAAAAADHLVRRLVAFRIADRRHPHPRIIEETNREGYDAISGEFRDELRVTTKNFHDASTSFWKDSWAPLVAGMSRLRVLELGAGNGWLFQCIDLGDHELDALDLSESMEIPYAQQVFRCSARNIPVEAGSYDLVVGSLVDPLLTPETFIEIDRVLKNHGKLVITAPSWEWASNLPDREDQKTSFQKMDGRSVQVFSFCDSLMCFLSVKGITNLSLIVVANLTLGESYRGEISPAIVESSKRAGKERLRFPIVTGLILERG